MTTLNRILLAAGLIAGFTPVLHAAPTPPAVTPANQLKVPKDFKVELLHTVPQADQGSWVALCTEKNGRLIVSDQYGKLYRLTPPALGTTDGLKIQPIDLPVGQAQGLLYAFDSLYVMVANEAYQGRGLYRVKDTNGDDTYDEVKLLRKLEGGGEHGPHAILPSPDGKTLTIISGNQTKVPVVDSSVVPLHWSEDHLLPRMADGRRFMVGVLAPGGWIAKTDTDGKTWELRATGFRNEYDAAYNRSGELFAYDADMEYDVNTPWYRPTRVNHVISGAEFGWRNGAGKWPAHYPDSFGAVVNIGVGSPTGVACGYGAKFPAKYQEALFICDWSYGKMYAVHMNPDGSSYVGEKEEFISGSPLALTDLVVNPADGALYFAVGGRRTQSGLYRVTYTGNASTRPSKSDTKFAKDRELRQKLEAFHGKADPNAVKEAWKHLGSKDRAIRFAARIAIEWQPVAEWRDKALAEKDPVIATHAILALARSSSRDQFHRKPSDPTPDPTLQAKALATLDRVNLSKLDASQQTDLLRTYAVVFTRLGRPDAALTPGLIARFDAMYPAKTREQNAELANLLVYLEAPSAAPKLMARLAKAPTQEEQLEIGRAARMLKTGWSMDQRRTYFNWVVKAANFRGGASMTQFVRDMKNDAITNLPPADLAALKTLIDTQPPAKKPSELLAGRQQVKDWTVADLDPVMDRGLRGGRDFARGRELFGAVGCAACHRFDTEGGAVGPDLTGLAGRFNARDVLVSTIEPSKEISDQYGSTVFTLKNGDEVVGRVANLNGDGISVMTDMFDPGNFTVVKRSELAKTEMSKTSMMPTGLLNSLKQDEILDLMAYLLSRGDPKAKMFR